MNGKNIWILDVRICWVVLMAFSVLSLVPANGSAALIESRLADGSSVAERAAMIETVRQALETEVVTQRLADFGLTADEIAARLPELSDEQLHQLAGLSGDLAGGGAVEAVIAVLLIIFLVVVILKLVDREIVIR